MGKLLAFLSKTPVILFCLVGMTITGFSFSLLETSLGGTMLDLASGSTTLSRLAEMSAEQKKFHILITATLDSLYPILNFGFLAGVVARLSARWRKWALLPAFIYLVSDFSENVVQIIILKGHVNLLSAKNILTPIKFTSFLGAAVIAIILLLIALVKWTRRNQAA